MTTDPKKYKDDMDMPVECLAIELFGVNGEEMSDPEIIEHAIKKIRMLKEMLLATGMNQKLLDACMKN